MTLPAKPRRPALKELRLKRDAHLRRFERHMTKRAMQSLKNLILDTRRQLHAEEENETCLP